ncbi:vacuolar protein sorting-associating protein 4A, putative [Entamoeba dispar SAW760]|uniref:Vacuolar protein sorting-associating protein 4A, putative n=1 Tax=Entamoeba dispar (strain ATCC PRA-260 / SAW760) TaxID=370354 RepID=B0E7C2_ENTDS|nr:vacuolar protein sorting-associating protein 4A, putative [Entamoeba dispar SAW760]EDR29570.1 vacuolar protein sorting-associating protein 4A, putative [Entamoeba dispar SAW760]|eukprot:EDR29570.1 vacuolar protein sorting-associating protein 4A, putative [Entamoeba dispar SAW760]
MTSLLDKGKEFSKKAMEEDEKGNSKEALEYYKKAIDCLVAHKKTEKNEKVVNIINKRVKEYVERAEYLKRIISGERVKSDDPDKEEDAENKARSDAVGNAVLKEKPNVHWEDVIGLEKAKEALQEAVILPIKFPQLFTDKRKPWTGILLFGPPGTGKSFLAKAVATEADSTFYSVSASSLLSKYLGESEKMVKELFETARKNKPSIIFVDEVDSLCSSRGDGETEASRRVKTEFLVQMNGVGNSMEGVLMLGATNIPWQLDTAIRRRFEKRIYIGLPDASARAKMIKWNLGKLPNQLTDNDFKILGEQTDLYSGSDIATLCKDAIYQPVRTLQAATHFKYVTGPSPITGEIQNDLVTPCSPGDKGAMEMNWKQIEGSKLVVPPVTMMDFMKSIKNSRSSISIEDVNRHREWAEQFGQDG